MNDKTPTFVPRTHKNQTEEGLVDANAIIKYYSSLHPTNKLIPNSPLYIDAVNQYNTTIKNTLQRPPIPTWFCGKINNSTNELIITPPDADDRAANAVTTDLPSRLPALAPKNPKKYNSDACLQYGTPGSAPYVILCQSDGVSDDRNTGIAAPSTANCSVYTLALWPTQQKYFAEAAWSHVRIIMIIELGLSIPPANLQAWDNYYYRQIEPTIRGPMYLTGKTCEDKGLPKFNVIAFYNWAYAGKMGTVKVVIPCIANPNNPSQTSLVLDQRMSYNLNPTGVIWQSIAINNSVISSHT